MKSEHNIVLTGVPRGGTTLTCHLLNKVPDTVALHEPIKWERPARGLVHSAVDSQIDSYFAATRRTLLAEGTAVSQQQNGRVPDNPMGGYRLGLRWLPERLRTVGPLKRLALRTYRVSRAEIKVEKTLSANFHLCVKHTGPFTARLEQLTTAYRCYAIIRHPLAVLLSWQTIDFALRDGRFPEVEGLDPALAGRLKQSPDRLARQVILLTWFFERYRDTLPADRIIRYEAIIASRGVELAAIVPGAARLDEPLRSQNRNRLYDRRLVPAIASALLAVDGAMWDFYSRESVIRMAEKWPE